MTVADDRGRIYLAKRPAGDLPIDSVLPADDRAWRVVGAAGLVKRRWITGSLVQRCEVMCKVLVFVLASVVHDVQGGWRWSVRKGFERSFLFVIDEVMSYS